MIPGATHTDTPRKRRRGARREPATRSLGSYRRASRFSNDFNSFCSGQPWYGWTGDNRRGRADTSSAAAGPRGRDRNLLPLRMRVWALPRKAIPCCELQLRRLGQRALTVHFAAMTNLDDLNDSSFVVNRVDDPVGTLPNPIALGLASKLLATGRTRSTGKTLDARHDPDARPARLDGSELFRSGRLDEDAIACHAAEDP